MNFDRKRFGSRFKAAILKEHRTLANAVELCQKAGMTCLTPPRMSEYTTGMKVPTLERFHDMVRVLGLDVRVIFPDWAGRPNRGKVRAIRHPGDRKNYPMVLPDPVSEGEFANGEFYSDADVWPCHR